MAGRWCVIWEWAADTAFSGTRVIFWTKEEQVLVAGPGRAAEQTMRTVAVWPEGGFEYQSWFGLVICLQVLSTLMFGPELSV